MNKENEKNGFPVKGRSAQNMARYAETKNKLQRLRGIILYKCSKISRDKNKISCTYSHSILVYIPIFFPLSLVRNLEFFSSKIRTLKIKKDLHGRITFVPAMPLAWITRLSQNFVTWKFCGYDNIQDCCPSNTAQW